MMLPSTVNGKKVFKCKCGAIKEFSGEKEKAYKQSTKIEHSVREEVVNVTDVLKWKEEYFKTAIQDFKCQSCGYDKATLETMQTRRADEGMTHYIICLNCGKMTKIRS